MPLIIEVVVTCVVYVVFWGLTVLGKSQAQNIHEVLRAYGIEPVPGVSYDTDRQNMSLLCSEWPCFNTCCFARLEAKYITGIAHIGATWLAGVI